MNTAKVRKRLLTPTRSISVGFVFLLFLGAFLLTLPISIAEGNSQTFIDALFTASSAITTTGLITVDTGTFYSLFGQIIILILFQLGGLGYMIFVIWGARLLRKKLSFRSKTVANESWTGSDLGDIESVARFVVPFAFIVEFIGALVLSIFWMKEFAPLKAIYFGIFHSVSAFSTAGFSLFADSFSAWNGSVFINVVIFTLSMTGAIGFLVILESWSFIRDSIRRKGPRRFSLHSKLALTVSVVLLLAGTVIILISEPPASTLKESILNSAFQSMTASSTVGFNTVDIGAMSDTSVIAIMPLMFVGASPGGTGGGVKTVTFIVMLLTFLALLKGKKDVSIFKNRISSSIIRKAFVLGFAAILTVVVAALLLSFTENVPFLELLFEILSALGTVGLSMGITADLTFAGKIIISILMLVGRLGPLAVGLSLIRKPRNESYRYVSGNIFI